VTALLFDLDDTLLDYNVGVDDSWATACTSGCVGRNVDTGRLIEAVARSRRTFWDDPERNRRERLNMLGAWTKIVAGAFEEIGIAHDGLAETIAHEFLAHRRERMRLFPETRACLERWHRAGVPLGLVTNGDATQQRYKIERWDLARFFRVVVIEGEFGVGKPDAAVYRHALDSLGAAPNDALMIGDNLDFDVDGAQRFGLRGVWIDRHARGIPAASAVVPWRVVRSLDEVTHAE
jgi:putative hydrolase of the HAD superfamily